MKKIFLNLLVIFTIIGITQVNALDPQAEPQTFIYGDYEYLIEGFDLKVYEMYDSESTVDKTLKDQALSNYLDGKATRVIPLNPTIFFANPEYKDGVLDEVPTTFIDLNVDITEEHLREILKPELASITEDKGYLLEVTVNYKFTQVPLELKKAAETNTLKNLLKNVSGESFSKEINIKETNSQVIVFGTIAKETGLEPELMFTKKLDDKNTYSLGILNFLGLSKDGENVDKVIMFHNVDNIDYIIENSEEIKNEGKTELEIPTPPKEDNSQVVQVENTASAVPKYVYILSILAMTCGALAIALVIGFRPKKQKYI